MRCRGLSLLLFFVPVTLTAQPELTILQVPVAIAGQVDVPVVLATGGATLAGVAFSVEYDTACLTLDPADGDGDGIPDAVAVQVPQFDVTVLLGGAGKVDVSVVKVTAPPLPLLNDGPLVTLTFTTACVPPLGSPTVANVSFSTTPAPSFSNDLAQDVPGTGVGGAVLVYPGPRGDCDGNGAVTSYDVVAAGLELFDADGSLWSAVEGGTHAGSPAGCDANADGYVDAGDPACQGRLLSGQTCSTVPPAAGVPQLDLPALLSQTFGVVPVQVNLASNGHSLTSVAFSLDFDASLLSFDPTDSDADGIPDDVLFFAGSAGMRHVSFVPGDTDGELDFVAVDPVAAPQVLTDGLLALIHLRPLTGTNPFEEAVLFSIAPRASFGDLEGRNVRGGTVEIGGSRIFADGFEDGTTNAWSGVVGKSRTAAADLVPASHGVAEPATAAARQAFANATVRSVHVCASDPLNLIANCGFENAFAEWDVRDVPLPFFPVTVGPAGVTLGFGQFTSAPTEGVLAVLHGFEGAQAGTVEISQDVTLPEPGQLLLEFDYRGGWDLASFGAVSDRTFEVRVESAGGGEPFAVFPLLTAAAGTVVPDTGPLSESLDLGVYADPAVRLNFVWNLPEDGLTGPAFFQLDNVSLTVTPLNAPGVDVPALSPAGLAVFVLLLGGLSLGYLGRRAQHVERKSP